MSIPEDIKNWYALGCPTVGLRFDTRTLELLDSDRDGFIRTDEVLAALEYLKQKGVSPDALDTPDPADETRLNDVLARVADVAKLEPSELEKAALDDWERRGAQPEIAVCGDDTANANDTLAAVEAIVDDYFKTPDDMPLVTDEADVTLPLGHRLNPRHADAIRAFAARCVTPLLGVRDELTRTDWKAVKAKFAPYRAWLAAKPVVQADAKAALLDEERLLRYKLHLGEFLDNFITMSRLFDGKDLAIFQTGVLRIDGKELNLCFHVEGEAAHAALAEKSKCCVIYVRLTRPADNGERLICAVVTAGTIGGLYVGRNGIFYDRDGNNWQAVVTRVITSQVSLAEAFWAPWRKVGECIGAAAGKFLNERRAKADAALKSGASSAAGSGATLASAVAAIGIGMGMAGAACASVLAAVRGMSAEQLALAIPALILVVSLPSVILAWFKLRKRDLGAILNASDWAVNRDMRFSMRRASAFTKCAKTTVWWFYVLLAALVLALVARVVCTSLHHESKTNITTTTVEVKK